MSDQTGRLLNEQDRHRFVAYLHHEISSDKGLLEQMERLRSPSLVLQHWRIKIAAYSLVLRDLENMEIISLSNVDTQEQT